jgi:hypothetical protein
VPSLSAPPIDEEVEKHGELKVVPPADYIADYMKDVIRDRIERQERDRVLEEAETEIARAADMRISAVASNVMDARDLRELLSAPQFTRTVGGTGEMRSAV